ncbi:hypothetical protein MUCCIDRAFT_127936, partial [Mucor lusitanicus CBS 277.49]
MEYVGRLGSIFTSVHNFYNEINPATLSGAIDIVVVEQEDGDLACSPFHVRFGKLSVLMPQEKRVQIKVNGQVVPYVMKVGEAGEAFFVFETEHEVPEEFQTSPIMEAVPEKSQEDPPYLDIGESKDKPKDKQAQLQSPKMIIEEQMDKVVTKMDPYNTHDDHIELPEPQIYPVDDGGHMVERVIPEAITTTTVAKERFIVRPAGGDLYNTLMEVTHTSVNKGDSKDDASIVLDIAGYKTGGGDDDEWNQDNQVFATPDAAEALEKEMTQLLLDENVVQSPPALDGLEPADQRVDDAKQQSHDRGETSYQTAQDSSVVQVPHKVYAKTLRLTSDQLKSLSLKKGVNTISFSVSSAYQGTATCAAKIFYWDYGIQVVISDIDGTITKSDTLGHVFTMIGKDWTHMGVAKLYTDIANNGYHFLYLTSRAIGQADYTRDYLKKVAQDKYQLPDGPVIMSPDRLFTSLHREVIMRKPEVFKMACLRDVQRLFGGRDPFYAGFGNRITDARSYRSVNVPASRIFTIDPYGDLKLELLLGFKSSYIHLNDLVDQIFPPINRVVDEEFNDWNYWKAPVADIDIPELDVPVEPVSPKPK